MTDRHEDALDRFFESLWSGKPAPTDSMLDTGMLGDAVELHSLSQTPIPGSARERARQRVFDSMSSSQENDMTALTLPASVPATNGHSPGLRVARPRPAEPARISRRHFWFSLAAVLALLLAGLSGWFAYDRFGGNASIPAMIPAVQDATPTPGESGWPQFRGGAARTGYSSDPGPGGNLDLRWTFTAGEVLNNLVSDGTSVYVYGRKGDLYALDRVTGAQRWGVDLSPSEYSDENRWPLPAVQDGVVYTGTYEGNIVALDAADGSLIWQRAFSIQPIVASPAISDGALYVVTPEGTIVKLDLSTGATEWEWTGKTALSTWAGAVGGGLLYIGDSSGNLVAIDTGTGETAWIAELGDTYRNPAYGDGTVYIGNEQGSYYAIDATDGSIRWTSEPETGDQTLNPVVTPNLLIATWMNGPMKALDRTTGQEVWSVDGPGASLSPSAGSTTVYGVSSDLTSMVAYDLATGKEMGRVDAEGLGAVSAISGETLVFGSLDDPGVVRAFAPGEGDVIENTAGTATEIAPATPVATGAAAAAGNTTSSGFDQSQIQVLWSVSADDMNPLARPGGMAIAPDGNIYIADGLNDTILVYSPDGKLIEQWGETGTGPGQFRFHQGAENWLNSIAFDADGNLYVFDTFNSRVQKFAPDHTFLLEWGSKGKGNGEFAFVVGGTVDAQAGLIYVADSDNNRVQVFDLDGNYLDKWGGVGTAPGQFRLPVFISVDPQGNVYVSEEDGSRVQKFDATGRYLDASAPTGTLGGPFRSPFFTATDAAGRLFVADFDAGKIEILDPDGAVIGTIDTLPGLGALTEPTGIAIDAGGNLIVGQEQDQRIVKLALPPLPE